MQLIGPLAAGIAGAENGFVRIYRRGTSSFATYYTTFEADTAIVSTGNVALDPRGGIVAYVNELVDCVVVSSGGEPVVEFVAGESAPAVEVISQSFTGVNYEFGTSGASEPTTLQTILDLWYTSNGAIDWKIVFNGAATSIRTALASIAGIFVNVKDPTYDAKGDGTTDDASSIVAAMTAAAVSGGIVWFPAGTYLCNSGMTVPDNVSLMGAGPAASYIKFNGAAINGLAYSAASSKDPQMIRGLRLGHAQANTGLLVAVADVVKLVIEDCYIGDANTKFGVDISVSNADVRILSTTIQVGDQFGYNIHHSSGVSTVLMVGGRIIPKSGAYNSSMILTVGPTTILGVDFDCGVVTSGAVNCVDLAAADQANLVAGCRFGNTVGPTMVAINGGAADSVSEIGNQFGTGVTPYGSMGNATNATRRGSFLGSRATAEEMQTTDGNPTVNADRYGLSKIKRGAGFAGATTLTFANPKGPGLRFTLIYDNPNGGGATGLVTPAGNTRGLAAFTVNANVASLYDFVSVELNSTNYWVLVGSQLNFAR
jgi:hypothetical protein